MRTKEQILEAAKVAFENKNKFTQKFMTLEQFIKIEENKDLKEAAKFRTYSNDKQSKKNMEFIQNS
jgi:hypothetical protein